jgi:hypothetical protein
LRELALRAPPVFRAAVFRDAVFLGVVFRDAVFLDPVFLDAVFLDPVFLDAVLRDAVFLEVVFREVVLRDPVLRDPVLRDAVFRVLVALRAVALRAPPVFREVDFRALVALRVAVFRAPPVFRDTAFRDAAFRDAVFRALPALREPVFRAPLVFLDTDFLDADFRAVPDLRDAVLREAVLRDAVLRAELRPDEVLPPPPPDSPDSPSDSSSPSSFFATPTAAGIATPIAAPATTFCGVESPPPFSSSSSAAIGTSRKLAGLAGLVERLDESRHDSLPDDIRPVLCEILARRLGSVLGDRDEDPGRRFPRALSRRRENRRRIARAPGALRRAPIPVVARVRAAPVVRERLAHRERRGAGRGCGRRGLERGGASATARLRHFVLLGNWHVNPFRRRQEAVLLFSRD